MTMELTEFRRVELGFRDYDDVPVERHRVEGDGKEACFRETYTRFERPLRYINDRHIRLDDPALEREYREWLRHNLTMDLYYGDGTVD